MSVKLQDLAEKLDSSVETLLTMIRELDFDYDKDQMTVEDDLAELLEDEIGTTKSDTEVMVERLEENLEREVVKTQRKKTAGKDAKSTTKSKESSISIKVDKLEIGEVISVKELAEKTGVNAAKLIGELMKNGILANINQQLDFETASLIAAEFGVELKRKSSEASLSDLVDRNLDAIIGDEDAVDLTERPPVVTIMGHVDHGKTKLLDTIRSANVVAGESGGITQHIGAYQVEKNGRTITFLDTPGHEAFTEMRSRGAKVTDIAVLVVSAVEGVKPTTIEAINHAKEAGVPIIVAVNKMDLPDANPDKVKAELVEYELQPEEWGGSTITVNISALTGQGVDNLLEMILLQADLLNLKANSKRPAVGTVIETHLDPGLGPVATVIINTGTLKISDSVVVGDAYGKIKAMKNQNGKNIKTAEPSVPVLIAGLSKTPFTGDILQVFADERDARDRAMTVSTMRAQQALSTRGYMADIVSKIRSGEMKVLKLIIKADTKGSFEAIKQSLDKVEHEEVMVKIIHSDVGNVKESDVMMAAASDAAIFGFHVDVPPQVEKSAEQKGVMIKVYSVIYQLIEDVTNILSGLLSPETVVIELGKAEVRQIFLQKKKEMIAGLKVTNGVLQKGSIVRVVRNGEQIGEGRLLMIKRVDTPVDEIKAENECGVKYTGDIKIEEGDVLEAYKTEQRQRSL